MPGSTITNPSLNDDLRDDDPDSRNQELDDERRIEADNEYYDGDKDQASFVKFICGGFKSRKLDGVIFIFLF
jgi:hypothetical protein